MKPSEVNHLRRLVAYVRCEIGQSPDEMVATVQSVAKAIGYVSPEGQERMVAAYSRSKAVPIYVRQSIIVLTKYLKQFDGPQ